MCRNRAARSVCIDINRQIQNLNNLCFITNTTQCAKMGSSFVLSSVAVVLTSMMTVRTAPAPSLPTSGQASFGNFGFFGHPTYFAPMVAYGSATGTAYVNEGLAQTFGKSFSGNGFSNNQAGVQASGTGVTANAATSSYSAGRREPDIGR